MQECLDYIKETGMQLEQKNDEIKRLMNENKGLTDEIHSLSLEIKDYQNELKNLRRITERWHQEYEDLSCRYDNLESLTDAMSAALSQIAPDLFVEIQSDIREAKIEKYIWSDVADKFNRSRW